MYNTILLGWDMRTLPEPASIDEIRQALANLYNPRVLETLPVTATLIKQQKISGPAELSDFLIDALEKLRPAPSLADDSLPCRRYRYLHLRYVEYRRHQEIARELHVSPRQARRIHQDALERLRDVIWRAPPVTPPMARPPGNPPRPRILPAEGSAGTVTTAENESPLRSELWVVGRQPPDSAVSLLSMVESIRDTCRPILSAQSIALEIDIPPTVRPVWYHRVSLRQILLNMLLHLVQSGTAGTVRVEVQQTDEETALSMLYRAARPPATRHPATSEADTDKMLRAAQYLAQLQDSRLCRLEASDDLQRLVLRIPARTGRTVLLVDDNPHIGLMFAYMLEGSPYHLIHVRTTDRALRTSREQQPSVIILDVVMPARDGWEVLTALRQDPATASVPVIVCSVLPDRDLALALGATDFLGKPVTRDKLLEALDRSCRR